MSSGVQNVTESFDLVSTLVVGAETSLAWESGNPFNPGSTYSLFVEEMLITISALPVLQECSENQMSYCILEVCWKESNSYQI